MGDLPRRRGKRAKAGQEVTPERLLLTIQANRALLDWNRLNGSVLLVVETILPDEWVIPVVEELQRQREAGLDLPEVFVRLEVPDKKEGLPH